MRKLERGYSVPLFLIIALLLLIIPVYYWMSTNSLNLSSSSNNVRGVSTVGSTYAKPGFSVSVTADTETWDLVEYLCKTLDECTTSLTSGRRLETVSGGAAELHEVIIEHTFEWDEYKYIKYFVKPGWHTQSMGFKVLDLGSVPNSQVYKLTEDGSEYDAVISPVAEMTNKFYKSAHFSDQ